MQVVDVTALSTDELQKQLIKHGMTPGPIVASTRGLYEKKLLMLMVQGPAAPPVQQNGQGDLDQYSDSEDKQGSEKRVEPEIFSSRNRICNPSCSRVKPSANVASFSAAGEETESTLSITKMVAQLEKKSLVSAATEDLSIQEDYSQAQEKVMIDKNTMTCLSRFNTPVISPFTRTNGYKAESFMLKDDVLKELFPDERTSPTGINATRRKPIKGAAGRPIQFSNEDFLIKIKAREQMKGGTKNEQNQPLVPVWSKVLLILLIILVFYVLYYFMEMNEESPFSQLVDQSNMAEP